MSNKKIKEEVVEMETITSSEVDLDLTSEQEHYVKVEKEVPEEPVIESKSINTNGDYVSCLKKKVVIVRFLPKNPGKFPAKHPFYGNKAENAVTVLTVPIVDSSGSFVNVLTNQEKSYLEEVLGLENNAMSVHKKKDNFWENYQVRLTKGDQPLDLSDPNDYIKYKVLLANKDLVAASLTEWQDLGKATYQYVIVDSEEQTKLSKQNMNASMQAYMVFGKMQDEADSLRLIVETFTGRPLASNTKIDFLHAQIQDIISANARQFLNIAEDPFLSTKVLIRKAIEAGIISRRGTHHYMRSDGTPLCSNNEEPTLTIAAKYLNLPKNQELKLSIEAKLNK